MKTKIITAFLVAVSGFAPGMWGQSPTSPAPTVTAGTAIAAAPAPAVAPVPSQVVYAPRLPTAQELMNAAAAQGLAVTKIAQTDSQVTATYQNADGQLNMVSYLLLPTAGTSAAPAMLATPSPTVVYAPTTRVIYYDSPGYYYDPWYWYPPVSVSLGFGFRGGGYYHSGFGHGFPRGRR